MWNDPYIAEQMLKFHLNESHDIASRRPDVIDNIVNWIASKLNLQAGMSLLDLGCGPGLYTKRFSQFGLDVTGVDYSQNSIDYATQHDDTSRYICQDYLTVEFSDNVFDLVTMIYGDFCVLSYEERDALLVKIHYMLKPDGCFIFDVTQPSHHLHLENYKNWTVMPDGGFWKPTAYIQLENGFMYPDDITVHQYLVIELDNTCTMYRNWYHDYTPTTLTPALEILGYRNVEYYGDLIGSQYDEKSSWCGVLAYKI